MAVPDWSPQTEADLTPAEIQHRVHLGPTESLASFVLDAKAGRSEVGIEPISDLAARLRLVSVSLCRALLSRDGSHCLFLAKRCVYRMASHPSWCALSRAEQAGFWRNDDPGFSRDQLETDLGTCLERLNALQNGSGRDFVRASVSLELVLNWLSRHGVLADVPSLPDPSKRRARHALVVPEGTSGPSFKVSAKNVSAEETRRKADLFSWADRVPSVSDAELEPEQDVGKALRSCAANTQSDR
jgi:hypothetical protein